MAMNKWRIINDGNWITQVQLEKNGCMSVCMGDVERCSVNLPIALNRISCVHKIPAWLNHQQLLPDPTIQQPGFNLPCHTWSLMNRFQAGQRPHLANLYKCGLTQSPSCDCGQ